LIAQKLVQICRNSLKNLQNSKGCAYYLLYNGILGDTRPASGNVLTRDVLAALLALHTEAAPAGTPLVVFGESVRVRPSRLAQAQVMFKQIPYDVRAR
jgi:adenine-specific DNA-methyltransferase